MKIKSKTDLITNSSSEVFTIKSNGITKEEIIGKLLEIHKSLIYNGDWEKLPLSEKIKCDCSCGSGDGGRIEAENFEDIFERFLEGFPKNKKSLVTEEDYFKYSEYPSEIIKDLLTVFVDHNFLGTCQYVVDNYDVLEVDGGGIYLIYDKSGEKVIGSTPDYNVWDNLETDYEKYGKLYCDNYLNDEDKKSS